MNQKVTICYLNFSSDIGSGENDLSGGDAQGSPSGGSGWVGWLKGTVSGVSQKVAQKAKTSMDTMITTLDPQMKEFLCEFPFIAM